MYYFLEKAYCQKAKSNTQHIYAPEIKQNNSTPTFFLQLQHMKVDKSKITGTH